MAKVITPTSAVAGTTTQPPTPTADTNRVTHRVEKFPVAHRKFAKDAWNSEGEDI
jgi:hypothetical protein